MISVPLWPLATGERTASQGVPVTSCLEIVQAGTAVGRWKGHAIRDIASVFHAVTVSGYGSRSAEQTREL